MIFAASSKELTAEVAQMGHNNPPEPTPIEAARETISLLDVEASAWFDGTPIENERQAEDVARLLDAARKAEKQFDAASARPRRSPTIRLQRRGRCMEARHY
jgi:hypothetical protein